jgi:hypothetical protein
MRNKVIFAALLLLGFSACSLSPQYDEGVVWQYNLDYDVVAGVVQEGSSVFFADEKGNIFNVWMDTGNLKWFRTISNQNIVLLYSTEILGNGFLFVVSTNSGSSEATLRKYGTDYGDLVAQTNLPILPSANYLVYTNSTLDPVLILHSAQKIVAVKINNNPFQIDSFTSIDVNLSKIVKVLYGDNNFYIFDYDGTIVKTDNTFFSVTSKETLMNIYGSAIYYGFNQKLYVGGSVGILVFDAYNNLTALSEENITGMEVKYSSLLINPIYKKLYAGFSKYNNPGIGKYDISAALNQNWFCRTYDPFTYSPIYYSDGLNVVAGIDDNGFINVVNADTGVIMFINKYLGLVTRPNLKWARDYYGKTVYIPVNNPPRVFCFSLEYAVSQQN